MSGRVTPRVRVVAVAAFIALVTLACSSGGSPESSATPYQQRDATAGAIDVKARPIRIDNGGARFDLAFDSHSAAFDADPSAAVTLDVGGARWTAVGWDGDPPSGHHREGTLEFTSTGPASGTATLTIGGLPEPVEFSWPITGA
jgi:hypothetical protein